MKLKKILLYTPDRLVSVSWFDAWMLRAVNQLANCKQGRVCPWFPEKVKNPRRETDKNPLKKQLGDIAKLKGNSFFGKMIRRFAGVATKVQNLHVMSELLTKYLRPPFSRFRRYWWTYEIKEFKQTVMTKRFYQCGIIMFQLAKLQILESSIMVFWTSISIGKILSYVTWILIRFTLVTLQMRLSSLS